MTDGAKKPSILVEKWRLLLLATVDPDLTKADTAVLGYIVNSINSKTRFCFPALTTIADNTHVNLRTARRSIEKLQQLDYIQKAKRGHRRANEYRMGSGRGQQTHAEAVDTQTPDVGVAVSKSTGVTTPHQSGKRELENRIRKIAHTPLHAPDVQKTEGQTRKRAQTFKEWNAENPYAINGDGELQVYARVVDMPVNVLRIAWRYFKDRFETSEERSPDWLSLFRRSVREVWCEGWHVREGTFQLTTKGEQLKRVVQNERGEEMLDVHVPY